MEAAPTESLSNGDGYKLKFPGQAADNTRTHLKNVFWPNIFVGASFQILDIQPYASGMKLGPAAILNQNPIFETASNKSKVFGMKKQHRKTD